MAHTSLRIGIGYIYNIYLIRRFTTEKEIDFTINELTLAV